jgi:hypothetical protein
MKKNIALVLSAVFALAIVVTAHSQEDMTHVGNDVFPDPQRSRAVFAHEDHNLAAEIDDCSECHHVYEDGEKLEYESSEDMRCADCHELASVGDQPSLRKAFHVNCMGCHQQRKKGPIMCGECHPKS